MAKIIINENYNGTDEDLSIDILQTTGLPFHLTPDECDCRYLAEHWIDVKCERLFVSYRDGVYRVVEGQKRTIAAKMRFVSGKKLPCKVRRDLLTVEDEAKWFYELNHQKRKFSEQKEGFLARKYFDENWSRIVCLVENNGLHISYDSCTADGQISRLTTLETIYDDFHKYSNDEEFGKMIKLLNMSCIGAKESLMANFLKGFSLFYRAYKTDIDENVLRKCFVIDRKKEKKSYVNTKSYSDILTDFEKYKNDYAKISKPVAVAIRNLYNKTLRNKNQQLKLSKIEDLETDM